MLRRTFCLLPAAALLSACGFQLRRARAMPFSSIYLPAIRGELGTRIRQGLQDSGVEIVTDIQQAEVRLDIAVAGRDREILSLSGEGKVREYEGTELLARCFCHEIDHLDGKLYTSIASNIEYTEE